ncbi:MAG: aldo/keto reductase [Candidatus Devosia phytovorans]|uniref:Aldo/keto reductase n=1 Tax=Candidatus Devosia phytovorans TaxID=3121372 RepID=A0AAJ5VW35_9HYPH|nr:aldo/keto reductase [Devosia sp.]WEK05981.1 MAG: aldo/keto reductase [Devosia sp.]
MKNQYDIPVMGFGTYGRTGNAGVEAMSVALEVGYRHLDTAQDYGTESEVGQAVRRSGLPRSDVFVTTKIQTGNLDAGALVPSLHRSLDTLQLDQLDLTLIHWPSPNNAVPLPVYIEQLAEAHALGLTQLIGVSNFTIAMLREAQALLGELPIANNQVELNPLLQNKKLASFCKSQGISVTCYLPIARGILGEVPEIAEIAARHQATPEQVALAFELAKGYIAIPTSGKAERIRSNFEATGLTLTEPEMRVIEGVDRGQRVIDPDWGPDWD